MLTWVEKSGALGHKHYTCETGTGTFLFLSRWNNTDEHKGEWGVQGLSDTPVFLSADATLETAKLLAVAAYAKLLREELASAEAYLDAIDKPAPGSTMEASYKAMQATRQTMNWMNR